METIKVSSKSISKSVAGSIANAFRNGEKIIEIETIGAGALNQAIKGIAIARGYIAPLGIDLMCIPAFFDIIINDTEKTAIKLIVEAR